MENLVLAITLIGVLGVGAQWLAWRFNLPAIVLMAIAGILAGPTLGLFNLLLGDAYIPGEPPMEQVFGDFYRPLIGIAVAVILFEGGLTLNFAEIRGLSKGVSRLVIPGVPIAWALGTLAAYYVGSLSWSIAIIFAGIMIVTGPTVIIPLLRQSKLKPRPATLLKWEGIVNDPVGALLAVFVYEVLTFDASHGTPVQIALSLVIASILASLFGFALGRLIAWLFRHGHVPEYLKPPVLLAFVLICFEVANQLQHEAGLLAVTVMGMTLANAKVASINELRHFKENITVLLVSGVFIILTANLTWDTLGEIDGPMIALVLTMLFVVRPIAVFVSTLGTDLPLAERALTAWIAPRGIVAVAVSSFFGASLIEAGYPDGAKLIPLAFAMVFATVVLHGFTIGPLAKLLDLVSTNRPGVLIVGASPWSVGLAAKLKDLDIPVMIADSSWRRLRPARLTNLETYYGEILSEVTEHHVDLNRFGHLLAVSGNEAHNALVCTDLAPEMGRAQIYQVNARGKEEDDRQALSYTLQGKTFLHTGTGLDELLRRHYAGWVYQRTRLSEEYPPEKYLADGSEEREVILIVRGENILFASREVPIKPEVGDVILAYVPKLKESPREIKDPKKGDGNGNGDSKDDGDVSPLPKPIEAAVSEGD
ncbi:MAG: sodium:proton antiporter [Pseudomonadota bacterium]